MVGCQSIEIGNGAKDGLQVVKLPWVDLQWVASFQTQNIENTGYIIMFAFGSFSLVFFFLASDCLRIRVSLVFYLLMMFKIGRVHSLKIIDQTLD